MKTCVKRERPHVVVPLYVPLSAAIPHETAMTYVSPLVREWVGKGICELVAVAGGIMNEPADAPAKVRLVLLYGTLNDEDAPDYYYTFDPVKGWVETARMKDGDGIRCLCQKRLPAREALIMWIAGFLKWIGDCPSLYELSYALVEPQGKSEMV